MLSETSLYQLMYISNAKPNTSQSDIEAILHQCRKNNFNLRLSGMLIYRNNQFIQCLEGSFRNLSKVYNSIKADPRHSDFLELYFKAIDKRCFDVWQMGFVNMKDIKLPHFIENQYSCSDKELRQQSEELLEAMLLMYSSEHSRNRDLSFA